MALMVALFSASYSANLTNSVVRRPAKLPRAAVNASDALLDADTAEILAFAAAFKAVVRFALFIFRVPSRYWAANLSASAEALIAAVAASDCVSASKCLK